MKLATLLSGLCVAFSIFAQGAQASSVTITQLRSDSATARMVKAIWQPELDSVISSGSLSVSVVKAKGALSDESALEAANAKLLNSEAKTLMDARDTMTLRSYTSKFESTVERDFAEMINVVNDYAPRNKGPSQAAITRLRATFERLGFSDPSSLICQVTKAKVKLAPSDDSRPESYFQILIVNPDTGVGLSFFGAQGSM